MLWQKASATTVPTTTPASSRAHDSCSSVRIVVAPSRCLQNDAKSWRPSSSAEAAFIASRSSGRDQASTWSRRSGSSAPAVSAMR